MKSEGYITPSLHILKHDLSNLAPPKGEIKSSFSWTSLFKNPTSSTLCFGEPTLGNLNQVKLLCSISSSTLWDPTLAKSNQETEHCITKHIPLFDSPVHTGTPFTVPSSSSETNRVSNSPSSLVTTPSPRSILGKPKIEVTKVLTHNNGKNGEHFYVENWHNTTKNGKNSDRHSSLVTMDLTHHAGSNGEHSCVPFKNPTSSTLCFGEPTLGNLNQVKFLCSISSSTLWDPTLAKSNQETELCITKHIPLFDSPVHTGTPFTVPSSSSETNRVSNSHSSLVTTPAPRSILGKPKIEVTKVLTHNNDKNQEHFYVENWHNTTKNGKNSDRMGRIPTETPA